MKPIFYIILSIIFIFLIAIIVYCYFFRKQISYFSNTSIKFRAPAALTNITSSETSSKDISSKDLRALVSTIEKSQYTLDGNIISMPTFYSSNEDYPNSLPIPAFQGNCASCFGFAIATCLASRFYIYSCGVSGCLSYPQINAGSLNNVNSNLNELYKFRKIIVDDVFKNIDSDRDGFITHKEWTNAVQKYFDTFNSASVPDSEKHNVAQILVFILIFQSLGSINLSNKPVVVARAKDAFDVWYDISEGFTEIASTRNISISTIDNNHISTNTPNTPIPNTQTNTPIPITTSKTPKPIKTIDTAKLKLAWFNQPIALSAERIISCCADCMANDNSETGTPNNTLACGGGSLIDAWNSVRQSGIPDAFCTGYNLDSWSEGDIIPSCHQQLGPQYSFCTNYGVKNKYNIKNIEETLDKYESSTIQPIAIPNNDSDLPYSDPMLFRFRAKNVYKVPSNMKAIQHEIASRGPITSGFVVYDDWFEFAEQNMGGQLYNGKNPVGSGVGSLIYASSQKGQTRGGHAIVIVGWGIFEYKPEDGSESIDIPYWVCLNSYGYNWGTSGLAPFSNRKGPPSNLNRGGYFFIIRGLNHCGIEENGVCGEPDIDSIAFPGTVSKFGWNLQSPTQTEVSYIPQNTKPVDLGLNNTIEFKEPISGGGTFVERVNTIVSGIPAFKWILESSTQIPYAYTMFWPNERPVYCLDSGILSNVDALTTSDIIEIDNDTANKLEKVQKLMQNLLLVLDNEQMQLLNINRGLKKANEVLSDTSRFANDVNTIQVLRGTNNSELSSHKIGSILKVIPFKNLSITDLDKILTRCPTDI